jgi:hypothetical protein
MKKAPWTFDLAELAPAVLLFGHLGPSIVKDWPQLFEREASQATTAKMRTLFKKLPPHLTEAQRLSLKPIVDLTDDELSFLTTTFGSKNPIISYLEKREAPFAHYKPVASSSRTVHIPMVIDDDDAMSVDFVYDTDFLGDLPLLTDTDDDENMMEVEQDPAAAAIEGVETVKGFVEVNPRLEKESDDDGDGKFNLIISFFLSKLIIFCRILGRRPSLNADS